MLRIALDGSGSSKVADMSSPTSFDFHFEKVKLYWVSSKDNKVGPSMLNNL